MIKLKVGRNETCPCGSGRKYKKCCINQNIEWHLDDNGKIIIRNIIKNDFSMKQLKKVLDLQQKRFYELYGRYLNEDEPILFDQYAYSIDEDFENLMKLLEDNNFDPAYIYAARKTGRLVTKYNETQLTGKEIDEWNNAIEEFNHINSPANNNIENSDIENELKNELVKIFYIYGLVVNKCGTIQKNLDYYKSVSSRDYILFCVTKTMKSLKAINEQVENYFIEDSKNILRSIFENYLYIVYLIKFPEKVQDLTSAKVGLEKGTHEYAKTSSGKEDKRIIVNKATGERFDGSISSYKMACASSFNEDVVIFDYLYKYLSNYIHPSIFTVKEYKSESNFDVFKRNSPNNVIFFSVFFGTIILDQIRRINILDSFTNKDVENYLLKIKTKLISFCNKVTKNEQQEKIWINLIKRINRI